MKKLAAFTLALVMALALVACGGGAASSTPPADSTPAESTPAESTPADSTASGDADLTVWCWDPAFNVYAMEEAAKVYQQENPDFVLNVETVVWDDIQTRLITAATGGALDTLPDIFLCQDNAFQKNVTNYPEIFYDLTDSGVAFDQFAPAKLAYSVVDGKNYGVPFDNGTVVNAMRTDILEEAGLTIEDFTDITWSEYITLGEQVLAATGKPLNSTTNGESDLSMIMLQSAGASLFTEDGTINIANNDVLKQIVAIYKEMIDKGVLETNNNWDEYVASFTTERVAGTINGCWILASVQTADDQSGNWAITNLPSLDGVSGATNYSNNGGSSWAVTSSSQNPELAIDFLSKTFGGSVAFYETILPSSGALATYLPAGDSAVYAEPQPFFGDQPIYQQITEFAGKVPSNVTGVYYYEARNAMGVALTNIVNGEDIDTALQNAQEEAEFNAGG